MTISNLKKTAIKFRDNSLTYKIYTSHIFLLAEVLIASLCFNFGEHTLGLAIFMAIGIVMIFTCKDMLPLLMPVMLASMLMLTSYGMFIDDFKPLIPLGVLILLGVFLHPFIYGVRTYKGKMLWAIIAVAVAILIGGVGNISAKAYFRPVTLFYTLMLSIGIVVSYLYMRNYVTNDENHNSTKVIVRCMIYIGLMGLTMILPKAIKCMIDKVDISIQWSNNLSTFFLMTMPFAFYLSVKFTKYGVLYFLLGILEFIGIFLTDSRGGIIFGLITVFICVLCSIIFASKINRIIYMTITGIILLSLIIFFSVNFHIIENLLKKLSVVEGEARLTLFEVAVKNFLAHPIVGTGLGFMGDGYKPAKGAIYWYHSTPFQIIGSMGLVGVIAYAYQLIARMKVCMYRKCKFNLFAFISFLAFELMALVNPGDFAPFPQVIILTLILTSIEQNNELMVDKDDLLSSRLLKKPYKI